MLSLFKPLHASSKLYSFIFYRRAIYAWNHFPSNIKLLISLNSFKSAIKLFDLSTFLKCSFIKLTMSYGIIVRYVVFIFMDCC